MKILRLSIAFIVLFSCQSKKDGSNQISKKDSLRNYWPTNEWRTSTPSKEGFNPDTLMKLYDLYGEKGSIVVVRNGFIVSENYPEPFDTNYMHNIYSCTKTVTSILFGIAVDKGLVKNDEDNLINYFSDLHIQNMDSLKQSIKLKDVLSMSSGLHWRGGIGGKDIDELIHNQPDWIQFVLDKPMENKPGTHFRYNSGGTHLLSSIIQRESKMLTKDFAKKNLFKPLGIDSITWDIYVSPKGITPGPWGLCMPIRDMAKLGYLYLNNGKWDDKQIVSEDWVKKSTQIQISRGEGSDAYGYQWWILDGFPKYTYTARGWYGNEYAFITVVPDYDLVVAIAGDIPNGLAKKIIKNYVIKAIEMNEQNTPSL